MKKLILLLLLLLMAAHAEAATINAATCNNTAAYPNGDVQVAVNAAATGDTVQMPAGNCNWTVQVWIPSTKTIHLRGAGQGVTNITNNVAPPFVSTEGWGSALLVQRTASSTGVAEVSNFTWIDNGGGNGYGLLVQGTGTNTYNFHDFTINNCFSFSCVGLLGDFDTVLHPTGVMHHFTCNKSTSPSASAHCTSAQGNASANFLNTQISFTSATPDQTMGTNLMAYFEDCTITYPDLTGQAAGNGGSDGGMDQFYGTRVVMRYCTITNTGLGPHGADSAARGAHSYEHYRNIFNGTNGFASDTGRSGVSHQFQNTLSAGAGTFAAVYFRPLSGSWAQQDGPCDGDSIWDGNLAVGGIRPAGYPCVDQIGWFFRAGPHPTFSRFPNYYWGNTRAGSPIGGDTSGSPNYPALMQPNAEYFTDVGASCVAGGACPTGIGSGTTLPISCTAGATPNPAPAGPGVGFWKTNEGSWNQSVTETGNTARNNWVGQQGRLYKCVATDTWQLKYEPYTYPHPLQGSALPPNPSVVASPSSAIVGDVLTATVTNGPGNLTDWVGLYEVTAADTAYISWQYLNGTQVAPSSPITAAALSFTATQAGSMEFRFFSNNTFTRIATSNTMTISPAPTSPQRWSPGVNLRVAFEWLMDFLFGGSEASAASLQWDYDTTGGKIVPSTANVEWSLYPSGPWTLKKTIPSFPSSYTLDTTYGYYMIQNSGGNSNVVQYVAPPPVPPPPPPVDDDSKMQADILKLQSQMAGICRAAKAMGGSPTSLAGRLRKEVPCL